MKTIFITSLITIIASSVTLGNIQEQNENHKRTTMAEQDFQESAKLYVDCLKDFSRKCFNPEIVILKDNGSFLASGKAENEVIMELLKVSDFLTEVHGTGYYRMIKIDSTSETQVLAGK